MKKKIFTILLLATALLQGVYGFSYLECKGSLYSWEVTTANGKTDCPYIAFQTMPYNKGITYSIVDNEKGTSKSVFEYDDKLRVTGTINLQHVNIACKGDINPQQFKRWTVQYSYSYEVYVKETNNSQSKWELIGEPVKGTKSFAEDTPSMPGLYELNEKIVTNSVTIDASGLDISSLKVNTKYDVKIIFKVTPTYDEWGNYIGDDNPWYATQQVYEKTSGTFIRMPIAGTSIINADNKVNPQNYIYNDNNAKLIINLAKDDDLTPTKSISTTQYYGYSTNVMYAGNTNRDADYDYSTQSNSIIATEYISYNPWFTRNNATNNIEFYYGTKYTEEYTISNDYYKSLARFRGIPFVSKGYTIRKINSTTNDIITSFEYDLKDVLDANYDNVSINSNFNIKVKNATVYFDKVASDSINNNTLKLHGWFGSAENYYYSRGFHSPYQAFKNFAFRNYKNSSYSSSPTSYSILNVRSNQLEYKLASKLTLPKLNDEDKALRYKCVSEKDEISADGVILIDGKKVEYIEGDVLKTPLDVYGIEYRWQVRTVGKQTSSWSYVDDFSPLGGKILKPQDIAGAIPEYSAGNEDLLFYSSAYKTSEQWQFRQVVILKNFTYSEKTELYNYKIADNKYCIGILNTDDFFSIKRYPTLEDKSWKWLGDITDNNLIQTPCPDDEAETLALKIKFEPQSTDNFEIDDYTYDEIIKNCKVYELIDSEEGLNLRLVKEGVINNENKYEIAYTIPYTQGKTLRYRCVMELCGNKIEKDISIEPFARIPIDINKIEANGNSVITERDNVSKTVYMVCPKGKKAGVSLKQFMTDNNYSGFGMYSRLEDVVCPDTTYLDYPPAPEYPEKPQYPEQPTFDPTAVYEDYPNTEEGIKALDALIKENKYDTKYYRETSRILLSEDYNTKIYNVNKYLKEDYQAEYDLYRAEIDRIDAEYNLQISEILAEYQLARVEIDRENTKRKDEVEKRCEDIRSWNNFDNTAEYNTILLNTYAENQDKCKFYIRVKDLNGCYSDSIAIVIDYISEVTNNVISLSENELLEEAYLLPNENTPRIFGSIVSGGFGEPTPDNVFSYNYYWEYSYDNENFSGKNWEDITCTHNNSSNVAFNTLGIYLPENSNEKLDEYARRPIYIRRVVYSRRGQDVKSQIESISNVITIKQGNELLESSIKLSESDICTGESVTITIEEEFENTLENDDYKYHWDFSQLKEDVLVEEENTMLYDPLLDKKIIKSKVKLLNITEDTKLSVYRYNETKSEQSNTEEIFINVNDITLDYDVVINNELQVDINEEHHAKPGSKVVFKNFSTSDSPLQYVWTLQVQEFIPGITTDGTKSNLEAPSLYVYNPGENKIRLEVQDELGCRKSLQTAINVEGYYLGEERSAFVEYEEEKGIKIPQKSEIIRVYPTLLSSAVDNVVKVYSSIENYNITLTNVVGQVLYQKEHCNAHESINMSDFNPGNYLLTINSKVYKLIKK